MAGPVRNGPVSPGASAPAGPGRSGPAGLRRSAMAGPGRRPRGRTLVCGNKQFVIGIVQTVITDACLLIGPLAGVLGILLAVSAQRRAARAVAETSALVHGSIGSRGTVDPRALRDLAIVRYDALNEMSGQLSFSVALLNASGDGVVLTSINGRSETRTYAKVVLGGNGAQPLSPEEEQAVRSARLGVGLPDGAGRVGATPGRDVTVSVPGVLSGSGAAPVTPRGHDFDVLGVPGEPTGTGERDGDGWFGRRGGFGDPDDSETAGSWRRASFDGSGLRRPF